MTVVAVTCPFRKACKWRRGLGGTGGGGPRPLLCPKDLGRANPVLGGGSGGGDTTADGNTAVSVVVVGMVR